MSDREGQPFSAGTQQGPVFVFHLPPGCPARAALGAPSCLRGAQALPSWRRTEIAGACWLLGYVALEQESEHEFEIVCNNLLYAFFHTSTFLNILVYRE